EDIHLATDRAGLLWYESCRFWVDSNVEFLTMLRDHAEQTRAPFHMFPNPGSWWRSAQEIQDVARIASFIQSEENGFDYGGHSGMVRVPLIGDLLLTEYNNHALKHKYAQATRSGLRTTMHTRPYLFRSRHRPDFIRMNSQALRVNLAEANAFAGGGCKNVNHRYGGPEYVTRYREFTAANAGLYEGYEAYASVAMMLFARQYFYEHGHELKHSSDAAAEELLAAQIPLRSAAGGDVLTRPPRSLRGRHHPVRHEVRRRRGRCRTARLGAKRWKADRLRRGLRALRHPLPRGRT
ncbi:MAG: hypothetical protein ACOC7J_05795, partial [Armatimonadota bacterium]